jgi:hypothetical protein
VNSLDAVDRMWVGEMLSTVCGNVTAMSRPCEQYVDRLIRCQDDVYSMWTSQLDTMDVTTISTAPSRAPRWACGHYWIIGH